MARIDRASADFARFYARAPRWMSRVYHLFRLTGVLNDIVGVGAGLVADLWPATWLLIRPPPETIHRLLRWEAYFGHEGLRSTYNATSLESARRTLRTQITTFRGFTDFFVPVLDRGRADVVLVSGPFRTQTPTAADILQQWTSLCGTATDPYDTLLAQYVRDALDIPRLDARGIDAFAELLEILARAVVDKPRVPRDLERVSHLREKVFGPAPRWRQAKASLMVDPIMGHRTRDLGIEPWEAEEIGIVGLPNTIAAVMPTGSDSPGKGIAAALVAARAFQDLCGELSVRLTDTLTTPLEGYGSYFLFHVPAQRSAARRRLLVMERARQIMDLMRREGGVRITVGIGNVSDGQIELPECARRAVIALQLAVLQGQPCVAYDDVPGEWRSPELGSSPTRLLQELVESLRDGRLAALETREADYVRAVLVDASGRAEVARTHFESALDALLGVVRAHRTASDRTVVELRERLRGALARADSSPALAAAFHDDVEILIDLEKKPGPVELELKLARAARYVEDRCREPLTLGAVARQVQLSKNYFSSRFKLAYGTGFTEYLARIRIERAKRLLAGSELKISRVGEESGFASVPHFNRVFKKKVGVTPSRFRESRG